MISWIQQNFQQHFRIIFIVILGVVIIAFVFTIGSTPGFGDGDQKVADRPFFGVNLASHREREAAGRKAELSNALNAPEGMQPDHRLALLAYANELRIPTPTDAEVTEHIKKRPRFSQGGSFNAEAYNQFRTALKDARFSEGEVLDVAAEDLRIAKVEKLLGGPGFVLPADVKRKLEVEQTSWTVAVATIDEGSFNANIKPSDADLNAYFEKNARRWDVPTQVVVRYVEFPASAQLGAVQLNEMEIRAHYEQNPGKYPKAPTPPAPTPKAGQVTPPTPASDPAADYAVARPHVENDLRKQKAIDLAARVAARFTVDLDRQVEERKLAFNSPELEKIAAQQNVAFKDAPAFSRNALPAEFRSNPEIDEEAFKLNQARFFSDAIPTDDGAIVLFWKETIAPRQSTFAEVREKVTAAYLAEEKRTRFNELGRVLRSQLAAKVKAGEAFDKAVAAVATANNVKIEAKTFAPFTLRQQPPDFDFSLTMKLLSLGKGDWSEMAAGPDNKGRIMLVQDKKLPDASEANPEYVTTAKATTELNSRSTAHSLLVHATDAERKRIGLRDER